MKTGATLAPLAIAVAVLALGAGGCGGCGGDSGAKASPEDATGAGCPTHMARIDAFCVDRYEAYVVELDGGVEHPHSPYLPVEGLTVAARAARGVVPQAYVSQPQAAAACSAAGKRLCTAAEFEAACRTGSDDYPYGGTVRVPGQCNEGKGSFMPALFGSDPSAWTYDDLNDPRLDQLAGGLAPAAAYAACTTAAEAYDCVGNLQEWVSDLTLSGHGILRGGSYVDAALNGPGCLYATTAHEPTYHDYTTGFRCCADPAP